MQATLRLGSVLTALSLAAGMARAQFQIHDGDRIVFYGDSITDQRLYTTYTESYMVTRFPKMNVTFVHSGWGGDRVSGGGGGPIDTRLERDVNTFKPTVVTIMLGMNYGSYRKFDDAIFEKYTSGYSHIIEVLKKDLPGLRLTLIQPSPYDDVTRKPNFEGGYNAVLLRYSSFVKDLAQREGALTADLNGPVVAALEKAKEINPELAPKIIQDRVHPGASGHLLMAAALLKAWGAPATVSAVAIDAADGHVSRSAHCSVSQFQGGAKPSWDELEDSLPMPIDAKDDLMALVLKSSDFVQTLDQETVQVSNLAAAKYDLQIDGKSVGAFTKEELAAGVNLATVRTPMLEQALAVHKLTLEHNDIHFTRWRQVQLRVHEENLPSLESALKAMDTLDSDLVAEQRHRALPTSHHFELVPSDN